MLSIANTDQSIPSWYRSMLIHNGELFRTVHSLIDSHIQHWSAGIIKSLQIRSNQPMYIELRCVVDFEDCVYCSRLIDIVRIDHIDFGGAILG